MKVWLWTETGLAGAVVYREPCRVDSFGGQRAGVTLAVPRHCRRQVGGISFPQLPRIPSRDHFHFPTPDRVLAGKGKGEIYRGMLRGPRRSKTGLLGLDGVVGGDLPGGLATQKRNAEDNRRDTKSEHPFFHGALLFLLKSGGSNGPRLCILSAKTVVCSVPHRSTDVGEPETADRPAGLAGRRLSRLTWFRGMCPSGTAWHGCPSWGHFPPGPG